MRTPLLMLIVVVTSLTGCEKASNLDAPKAFFSKNKVGSSPDYGVIKWNNPEDHVITIHGFVDDLKSCLIVAEAMNKDACKVTGGARLLESILMSAAKPLTANKQFQPTIPLRGPAAELRR